MISKLEKHILFKLYRNLYIGGRHTSEDNVVKGLPKHVRGEAKKALKSLIKRGYIRSKPTSYGLQISLNPRMIPEIKQNLED
ncbi:MAG: hypothetical protein V3R82_03845 [Candidatus Hydrothermarchaeales archaeon]